VSAREAHLRLRSAEDIADRAGERALLAWLHAGVIGGRDLDHLAAGDEPVLPAARHDHDRVRGDMTLLGPAGLDLEALLDVLEGEQIAFGVDIVHVQSRGLGLVGDQELLHALLERIRLPEQDPDLRRVLQVAEGLYRRRGERVALVPRPVPARVAAREDHVGEHDDRHQRDHAEELKGLRGVDGREAELLRHQPHLHASTARTVTKRGSTTSEP
jgi:hypothetical protein